MGGYIVEDMVRGGLHGVTGVNFIDTIKEAMATALSVYTANMAQPTAASRLIARVM